MFSPLTFPQLTSARSINELNTIEDKSEGGSAVEDTVELDHEESFIARRWVVVP